MNTTQKPVLLQTNDELDCSICYELALDAVQCPTCAHNIACTSCATQIIRTNPVCPWCRCPWHSVRACSEITRRILQSPAKCGFSGCDFRSNYATVTSHIPNCDFRNVAQCTNEGCNKRIYSNELHNHLKKCNFRKIQCRYCHANVVQKQIKSHLKEICPEAFIKCLCSASLKRKNLEQHMERCDYGEAECDNSDLGCNWEGILRDKDNHKNSCEFEDASQIVDDLQRRCEKTEIVNIVLKRRLENALRELEQKKTELQSAANEILRIRVEAASLRDYVYVQRTTLPPRQQAQQTTLPPRQVQQTTRPQHHFPSSQHSEAKQAEGCTIS